VEFMLISADDANVIWRLQGSHCGAGRRFAALGLDAAHA